MVESDKRIKAGEIKAVGIEGGCGGPGSKSQGLGQSVLVAGKAGLASIVHGAEFLAGMEWSSGSRGGRFAQRWHGGRWWALNRDDGRHR